MDQYRRQLRSDPDIAKARGEMVEIYRRLKSRDPAFARLLFRRQKKCMRQIEDLIYTQGSGFGAGGGLSALFSE